MGCRGLRPGNTPGLIDPDYRGEILVCLRNESNELAFIQSGDRIAQLLIIPYLVPDFYLVDEDMGLPTTDRSAGGFGSTGA
jgi:dUTP pyrophosphatase